MKRLVEITNQPKQKHTVILENNETFVLSLEFIEQQRLWIYSIEYNDFVLNGSRLVQSKNMLRQFKNLIPFGLLCNSDISLDPFSIDDFTLQEDNTFRFNLYVLNADEVDNLERVIFPNARDSLINGTQ